MKHIIIIIALQLIFTQLIFSQENDTTPKNIAITFMPLSIIDYTPRYRFGIDYNPNHKFSYSIDIGIGHSKINDWRLNGLMYGNDYLLYELRPEVKYFFRYDPDFRYYYAVEFFYINMRDVFEDSHYQKENSNVETWYDKARFKRQKYGYHLILGAHHSIFKQLYVDLYGGIGMAKRIIRYTDIVNPRATEEPIFIEWMPQNELFEGESVTLHLALGFKFGFKL